MYLLGVPFGIFHFAVLTTLIDNINLFLIDGRVEMTRKDFDNLMHKIDKYQFYNEENHKRIQKMLQIDGKK